MVQESRMTTYSALLEARDVYRDRDSMTRDELLDAAASLGEWHLFSIHNIAAITGLTRKAVTKVARKWERTGGRFNPAALDDIVVLTKQRLRGEVDPERVASVVEQGVSTTYLARLTGIPQRTISRMAGKP